MKTLWQIGASFMTMAAISVSPALAQDSAAKTQSKIELNTNKKGGEMMAASPQQGPAPRVVRPKVTYEGFLRDVARSENLKRSFSLRQPIEHDRESPNLVRDPVDGRARGFSLFAIRF